MCNFKDGLGAATAATASSVGLDGCTRMRGIVLRKPPRRRSGTIREMALVMSRPSVVPRYAVTVGSLARGNGDMGATRKAIRPVDGL